MTSPKSEHEKIDPVRGAEFLDRAIYQSPELECDLVLKGGITSGVVYPPAILSLARSYRFRSIGGASAGAIGAAAAAAAEFGRESEVKNSGFVGLRRMQDQLFTEGFLFKLLQPSKETAPLFEFLLGLRRHVDADGKVEPTAPEKEGASVSGKPTSTSGASAKVRPRWFVIGRWVFRVSTLLRKNATVELRRGRDTGTLIGLCLMIPLLVPVVLLGSPRAGELTSFGLAWGWVLASALVIGVIARFVGGLVGGGLGLKKVYDKLASPGESSFGFCRGSAGTSPPGAHPQLIDWMSRSLNELAGLPAKGPPLTIGMLRGKTVREEGAPEPRNVSIEFKMVTTNLSHGRPYVLPFSGHGSPRTPEGAVSPPAIVDSPSPEEGPTARDKPLLIFDEKDMEMLFPSEVVEHLRTTKFVVKNARLPQGFFALPTGDDLPVVVATRLSLSFPVLLSAVRLYTIRPEAFHAMRAKRPKNQKVDAPTVDHQFDREDLEENWFSDGGIAVNFPLSIFDAWLPTRPTFGINLADAPLASLLPQPPVKDEHAERVAKAESSSSHDQAERSPVAKPESVILPRPRDHEFILPRPAPIEGFVPFFLAILDTARSYRDNTQMGLASYRERVAQVYLEPNEGGLNLDMPEDIIKRIGDKGAKAAGLFIDKFDFDQHRWVRARLLLSHIERELGRISAHDEDASGLLEDYMQLCAEQLANTGKEAWYRPENAAWCGEAELRMAHLTKMMAHWKASQVDWEASHVDLKRDGQNGNPFFGANVPTPEGLLRVTPDL